MEIKFNEDKGIWDKFISGSPQRSIFMYSKFLDSLNINFQLVTCYEDKKILAGAVILLDDQDLISSVFPFTQFQGIVLADNAELKVHSKQSLEFKVLEFFIDGLITQFKRLCFCQSWRFPDMRPFQWYNYHQPEKGIFNVTLRYTASLNIADYADFNNYLLSVRKVRRQEYNKASSHFSTEVIDDEKVLDELHSKTFQRQNLKRSERESGLLRKITRHALDKGYGRLTCVKLNGEPIAANLFLFDDRTGYYLFGANDPNYRNTFAGTLLLGDAIKDCMNRGIKEIDFVGTNSPNRGDYKLSFNPKLKPYFIAAFPNS